MKNKLLRNILVLVLAGAVVFLSVSYVYSLKKSIASLENQKQNLLQELEKEKKNVEQLNIRNMGLKNYLKAAQKRLGRLFLDLGVARERAERLGAQFSIAKAENNALLEERQRYVPENLAMKIKLSSVDELKKAIRELKRERSKRGNRGFIIKDGQLTSAQNIKIEVIPAGGRE